MERRAPLPATCSAGAVWRPWAPGAAPGVSCWRVSACRHARPCAVRVAGGVGDGGGGPRFWGLAPGGGAPRAAGPHSPPALLPATGRRAVVWAFAHGPPAPRVAAASSRGTGGGVGGGSGGRWRWRPGLPVSGQWSAGWWGSPAMRVRVPRAAGARPPLADAVGCGRHLRLRLRGGCDCGGGGFLGR